MPKSPLCHPGEYFQLRSLTTVPDDLLHIIWGQIRYAVSSWDDAVTGFAVAQQPFTPAGKTVGHEV